MKHWSCKMNVMSVGQGFSFPGEYYGELFSCFESSARIFFVENVSRYFSGCSSDM